MLHRTLRGDPLRLDLVTELSLASLLLLYGSSWMQLALGKSQATSAQLERLSRTDHLTGLYNRRSLYISVEALMAELTAEGELGRETRVCLAEISEPEDDASDVYSG